MSRTPFILKLFCPPSHLGQSSILPKIGLAELSSVQPLLRHGTVTLLLSCFLTLCHSVIFAQSKEAQIRFLTHQLSDKNASIRSQAAKQLGTFGHQAREAVYPLIEVLSDESRYVRRNAAFALGQIGEGAGESVPALIQTLEDSDWTVRANVTFALGGIGKSAKAAVPFLITAINDVNWEVSVNAVKSLGQIGPVASSAVPALSNALRSENKMIRNNAALALAEIGQTAVPTLIEALKDTDKIVRRSAAFSMSRIDKLSKAAILALKTALKDREISVRVSAAVVLALVEPSSRPKTMPILIDGVKSEDEFTRSFATYSLKKIREIDALAIEKRIESLIQQLYHQQVDKRYQAAVALGKMGKSAAGAVPDLIVALKDKDEKVRSSTYQALKQIGSPEAIEALNLGIQ